MLEHLSRRLQLRIVANAVEQNGVGVCDQLTVTRHHMRTGDGIEGAIDHPHRQRRGLHRRDPALPLLAPLGHVANQTMHHRRAVVVRHQLPQGIQFGFAGLSVRAEDTGETLCQLAP